LAPAERFDVSPRAVAVAGESAGGNLAAAVALKRMDAGDASLAGQALIYPQLSGTATYPSAVEFDGLVISRAMGAKFWEAYSGGRDLDDEPYAVPLSATRLDGLPPALVVLGGCDMLRDEGRAYAARLRDAGVDVDEVCYAGQPHGFVNFDFPAASLAFDHIGAWLRTTLARSSDPAST
jgi:acetyl esterase